MLRIAMLGDEHKEYELTKAQLDAFVNWYTARSAGTGDAYYTFNKDFNLGPFASRVDYLPFEKISAFEVLTIPE